MRLRYYPRKISLYYVFFVLLCITISIFLIGVSFLFKRKINDKKVTRRFDDSMSSLSNAKKISMNW